MKSTQREPSSFIYTKLLQALLSTRSAGTRRNFLLNQLEHEVSDAPCEEAYRLRKRIWYRFLKKMPTATAEFDLRVHGFFDLFSQLKEVPGEIVECGVGRGQFLSVFLFANAYYSLNRKVIGFDSFTGFPPASEHDIGDRVEKVGEIDGWADSTLQTVRDTIETLSRGAAFCTPNDLDRLQLIPGYFDRTLEANLPDRICFLHLDADLYESTRDCLQACLPRMESGSWIVFDELHETERWPGVGKAVDELCRPSGLIPVWLPAIQRMGIQV